MAQTLHWVTWRQIYCGDDTQRVLKCENLSSHTVMCFPFLVAVKEKWRWTRVIIVLQFLFIFYFMLNVFNSLSLQWDSRVGFVVSGFILWKCFLVLPFLFLCCTSCTHHFPQQTKESENTHRAHYLQVLLVTRQHIHLQLFKPCALFPGKANFNLNLEKPFES